MAAKKNKMFVDEELYPESFAKFDRMRDDSQHCDITVNFGNHSISAHKVVLAAALPYFLEVLHNTKQNREGKEIALEDIESTVLESLINYAYTGKIEITDENVDSLLYCACTFHVTRLRDACCKFLADSMNCSNVLDIRQFGFNLDCQKLVEMSENYVCENFEIVSKTDNFLKLPFYVVKSLIQRDDLKVACEDEVLRAVLNWAKTSPFERENYLRNLLTDIRIMYLSQEYYNEVVASNEIVKHVFSLSATVQRAAHLESENSEMRSGIRPRSLQKTTEYSRSAALLFIFVFMFFVLTTGSFSWLIGCLVTLAFDKHFRLVVRFRAIPRVGDLVKYVIIWFIFLLFIKSPFKCMILLLSKEIVDYVSKKNVDPKFKQF